MGNVELRYVKTERDRQGRVRYRYFRRNGRRWRLPAEPTSAAFMAEYQRLLASTHPPRATRGEHPPGSVSALARDYYASPEYRNRKPRTQEQYRRVLDALVGRYGTHAVALIERRHVIRWRDERAETPGVANMTVKIVGLLLTFAVAAGYRQDNPATGVKLYKLGEYRAWTDAECQAFETYWAPGTMQRRCYMLARCTGQRAGDLAKMTRADRVDGAIHVVQEKTGAVLDVPELQDLFAELARGEQHMSLLTRPSGGGFRDGHALGLWFAGAIDDAGLPAECVLHGLRKLAAKLLAEAGCSAHQIGAITGHTPQSPEITRYTRQADQKKMATAAVLKLTAGGNADRTRTG